MQNRENHQENNNCYHYIESCKNYAVHYLKTINPLTHASPYFGVKPDDINKFTEFKTAFPNLDQEQDLNIDTSEDIIKINNYTFDNSLGNFFKKLKSVIDKNNTQNAKNFTLKSLDIIDLLKEYQAFLSIKNVLAKLQRYNENKHIGNYDHIIPDALGTIIAPALSYIKQLKTPLGVISILGSIANILEYCNGLVFNNKKDALYQELMPELASKIKKSENNIKSGKVKTTLAKVLSNLSVITGYIMSLSDYKSVAEENCLKKYETYPSEIKGSYCDSNTFDVSTGLKVFGGLISTALFLGSIYTKSKINDNHDLHEIEKHRLAQDIKKHADTITENLNECSDNWNNADDIYNILAESVFDQFGLGKSYPRYNDIQFEMQEEIEPIIPNNAETMTKSKSRVYPHTQKIEEENEIRYNCHIM